jgi:hypothetical protein
MERADGQDVGQTTRELTPADRPGCSPVLHDQVASPRFMPHNVALFTFNSTALVENVRVTFRVSTRRL